MGYSYRQVGLYNYNYSQVFAINFSRTKSASEWQLPANYPGSSRVITPPIFMTGEFGGYNSSGLIDPELKAKGAVDRAPGGKSVFFSGGLE